MQLKQGGVVMTIKKIDTPANEKELSAWCTWHLQGKTERDTFPLTTLRKATRKGVWANTIIVWISIVVQPCGLTNHKKDHQKYMSHALSRMADSLCAYLSLLMWAVARMRKSYSRCNTGWISTPFGVTPD